MKFRYIGEVNSDGTMTTLGHTFRLGEAVEVTNPAAIQKLSGNRFFECVGSDQPPAAEPTHAAEPVKRRGRPSKVPAASDPPVDGSASGNDA